MAGYMWETRRARLRTATWETSMFSPSETGVPENCWDQILILNGFDLCEMAEVATCDGRNISLSVSDLCYFFMQ